MKLFRLIMPLLLVFFLLLSGCNSSVFYTPNAKPTTLESTNPPQSTAFETLMNMDAKSEKAWRDLRSQEPANGYLYPAKVNAKWGFINSSGKFVIKPKYDWVNAFNPSGTTVVGNLQKNGKKILAKMIDQNELTVLDNIQLDSYYCDYPSAIFDSPLYINYYEPFQLQNGSYVVADQTGKVVYSSKSELSDYGEGFVVEGETAYVDLGKSIQYNQPGKLTVPKKFRNFIQPFDHGYGKVSNEDGSIEAWIDRNGTVLTKRPAIFGNTDSDEIDDRSIVYDGLQYDSDDIDGVLKKDEYSKFPSGYQFYLGEGVFVVDRYSGLSEEDIATGYHSKGDYVGRVLNAKTGIKSKLNVYLYQRFFNGAAAATDYKKSFFVNPDGKKASGYPVFDKVGELIKIGSLIMQNVHGRLTYHTMDGKSVFAQKDERNLLKGMFGYVSVDTYRSYDFGVDYPCFFGPGNKTVEEKLNKVAKKMNDDLYKEVLKERKMDGYEVVYPSLGVMLRDNLLFIEYNFSMNGGGTLHIPYTSSKYFDIRTGEIYNVGSMFKDPKTFKKALVDKAFELYSKKKLKSLMWFDTISLNEIKDYLLDGEFFIYKDGIYITEFADGSSNHLISFEKVKIPFSKIRTLINYDSKLWNSFKHL